MAPQNPPSIRVTNLTYTFTDRSTGVSNISLSLPPRSRTLLIGANGAGKTTLLRLLAGKRLAPRNTISVSGKDPFAEGLEGVTYLGLDSSDRRDELVAVLDIDTAWRMHAVSDGERRRVQLAMGLVRPWTVLFLDEITVDLDVYSRAQFLGWLRRETETRECTIVYATHILDNLAGWPTHLVHMHLGTVKEWGEAEGMLAGLEDRQRETGNSRLGELVLGWLKADLVARGPRSQNKRGSEGKTYDYGGNMAVGGYGQEYRAKLDDER
ncbi:p-loop containing nucleoside triphosphate hydrolase protein [Coniochaeta hoffmannii]|uniref:P-loop containing nucleoside triphosphate hydrolase protein n=1 Tax=Coniochaeta hoffmannii TaxID=91930 RepID=A0AA38RKI1_9PEZI|nr:p-loop containing nucleoside triphosphate hydrolase protein [Coniochaeta hoffmannii]